MKVNNTAAGKRNDLGKKTNRKMVQTITYHMGPKGFLRSRRLLVPAEEA